MQLELHTVQFIAQGSGTQNHSLGPCCTTVHGPWYALLPQSQRESTRFSGPAATAAGSSLTRPLTASVEDTDQKGEPAGPTDKRN